EVPWGMAEYEVTRTCYSKLYSLSRAEYGQRAFAFPPLEDKESVTVSSEELLGDITFLVGEIERNKERLQVLYGFVNPMIMLSDDSEPSWGGMMTGIRLKDDGRQYMLKASLGSLDLIKHEPDANNAAEVIDVRDWNVIESTNIGTFQVCRKHV